jgi:preprotein translocase subunit SecG
MVGKRRIRAQTMSVIIVIHLMIVLAMIGFVLLQKSEGGGLGIGSTGGFLSSRGTANVLTRTTAFLAMAFFATSLLLSWIASFDRKPTSILNTGAPPGQSGAPPSDTAPKGGLFDRLRPDQPAPPPGGPQVPQSQ